MWSLSTHITTLATLQRVLCHLLSIPHRAVLLFQLIKCCTLANLLRQESLGLILQNTLFLPGSLHGCIIYHSGEVQFQTLESPSEIMKVKKSFSKKKVIRKERSVCLTKCGVKKYMIPGYKHKKGKAES